jgi:hypothetical protein
LSSFHADGWRGQLLAKFLESLSAVGSKLPPQVLNVRIFVSRNADLSVIAAAQSFRNRFTLLAVLDRA